MPEELSPRASDADRDRAATALGDHAAAGRLTLDELTERLDRVYEARTRAELDAIAADLPEAAPAASPVRARRATRWVVAVMSGAAKRGRWRLEGETRVVAVMGGAQLDLRSAELVGSEVVLTCLALMGGIDIVVPEGVEVEVSGFGFMGGTDEHVRPVPPRAGTPLVRVRAYSLMGGINIRSRPHGRRLAPIPPLPPL